LPAPTILLVTGSFLIRSMDASSMAFSRVAGEVRRPRRDLTGREASHTEPDRLDRDARFAYPAAVQQVGLRRGRTMKGSKRAGLATVALLPAVLFGLLRPSTEVGRELANEEPAGLAADGRWSAIDRDQGQPDLPPGWRLYEIARVTPPYEVPNTVHVLAWQIAEDGRSLYEERCLLLCRPRFDDGSEAVDRFGPGYKGDRSRPGRGASRWYLVALFRHPREKGWQQWHFGPGYKGWDTGADVFAFEVFDRRPTNADVYAFTEEHRWRFHVDQGWRLVASKVCVRTWEAVLKQKPTRFFLK
jgi:hypothetical protein